jgi:hypothetical protein
MPTKLKQVSIEREKFFYSLSFDIDDFIGDSVWWLRLYDDDQNLIYDKPFASNMGKLDERKVLEIIQNEFITYRGAIL